MLTLLPGIITTLMTMGAAAAAADFTLRTGFSPDRTIRVRCCGRSADLGPCDGIVLAGRRGRSCWLLSRLARSLKQIVETAHELEQRKQAPKVLTRNIDTRTPEGRLFFHITAAFDEFQRELIVEKHQIGPCSNPKAGRRGGRSPALDKEGIRAAEAMFKDTANYPFVGNVIDRSGSAEPPSTDISRQIVSGNFEISLDRLPQSVSLYVTLSKRTPAGLRLRRSSRKRGCGMVAALPFSAYQASANGCRG